MNGDVSVAIIGTGALGGYYGGRLLQSGVDVHFLCHRDADVINQHGLIVESAGKSIIRHPARAYRDVNKMPRCDVVVVSLKTTANRHLPELLPPVVKPDGVVLVLQNGLGVEQDAADAAPGSLVLGGLCFLCANKPGPGHVVHLDYGDVVLGWHEPTGSREQAESWLARLKHLFENAHISAGIDDDLEHARWTKLVWNIPYNGLSVVHNTTTDVLMKDPARRKEVVGLMREVQALAGACGHDIEHAFIEKMLTDTEKMRPYKTSMLLDYEAGKPMELETMYERPLKAGEAAGAQAPGITKLLDQLAELGARN